MLVVSKVFGTGNHYPFPLQNFWVKPTSWKSTDILVSIFMGSGLMPAHLCCCTPHR